MIDTHCHIHDRKFDADRDAVVERAREAGVSAMLTIGEDLADSARAIGCAARYGIAAAAGIHPHEARNAPAELAAPLRALLEDPRVVAVSSFVAHTFRPDIAVFPASAAAKAGLEALVRALAIELAPSGVTVNAVVPGFIRKDAGAHRAIDPGVLAQQTARIPLGRIGSPADVAAAVAFLVSPAANYMTGQILHVDGGLVI